MFCRKCGYNLPDDAMFCPSCGEKVVDIPHSTNIIKSPNEDSSEDRTASVAFDLKSNTAHPEFKTKKFFSVPRSVLSLIISYILTFFMCIEPWIMLIVIVLIFLMLAAIIYETSKPKGAGTAFGMALVIGGFISFVIFVLLGHWYEWTNDATSATGAFICISLVAIPIAFIINLVIYAMDWNDISNNA